MQNHYEVLGLSMHATQEAIRRRYRELVRQYHPDVNPSPQAKERFLRIQEAYQVLSDPERRRHYDALLRLQMGEPPSARYSQPRTQPPRSTQSAQASQPKPSPSQDELRRVILQAERAFLQGRLQDALYWAKQATRLAPRHPKGHEIIGDVYRTQGHYDAALNAYTYAIQLDPNNADLQRKLDSMLARTQARAASPPSPVLRGVPALKLPPEWKLYAAQSLGWGAVLFLLTLAYTVPRRAADTRLEPEPRGVSGTGGLSDGLFDGGQSLGRADRRCVPVASAWGADFGGGRAGRAERALLPAGGASLYAACAHAGRAEPLGGARLRRRWRAHAWLRLTLPARLALHCALWGQPAVSCATGRLVPGGQPAPDTLTV
jgi:hypothetical protein